MSPVKNQLDDELIEQVCGGEDCDRIVWQEETEGRLSNYICPNCGRKYMAMKKRTDGYCPNCEPKPIPKIAPVGDIKTTVPDLPKKDKLIKIH